MSENSSTPILAALERLENGQTQIYAELGRLENGQTQIYAELGRLENGQTQMRVDLMARMDQLARTTETRMDIQDEVLARFRADLVDELGRTRSALMARMDRLQETLVRQQEDDVVNFGAADRAERIAKGAVDEGRILGEQFNALVRKVRSLEEEIRILRGGGV